MTCYQYLIVDVHPKLEKVVLDLIQLMDDAAHLTKVTTCGMD